MWRFMKYRKYFPYVKSLDSSTILANIQTIQYQDHGSKILYDYIFRFTIIVFLKITPTSIDRQSNGTIAIRKLNFKMKRIFRSL